MVNMSNPDRYKWCLLFSLWAFHGIIALWQYLSPFGGTYSSLLHSTSRLGVVLILLFWISINIAAIFFMLIRRVDKIKLHNLFLRSKMRDIILISVILILFISTCLWILFGLSLETSASLLDNYISIVMPLLNVATFFSCEVTILILIAEFMNKTEKIMISQKLLSRLFFVLIVLSLIMVVVFLTGLGVVPTYDKGDWSRGLPAVPLFEWHILVALMFSAIMALVEVKSKNLNNKKIDFAMVGVIWLVTLCVWLWHPIVPNASALGPQAPNFEVYPFTDAQTYDQYAQSALVGGGFGESIPPRPLYIAFLTIGHLLVGQDYGAMVGFQSMLFSFFPVLLYLFCSLFFGRPIGIAVSTLAIFRDFTSNLVSPFSGNLSYSKIFMSEIPTAMLLVFFLLLALHWIKKKYPIFIGFLMGGVLGLAMLIRTQASVALPVVVIFGFLSLPRNKKRFFGSMLAMIFAIILTTSPWLWRNWRLTGQIIFDSPEFQMSNIALRYGRLNGIDVNIIQLPDESYSEYSARLNIMAVKAVQTNPQRSIWGVANTFLNHGVNNILLFPLRLQLTELKELWDPENAFWELWNGKPTLLQSILIFLYVFIFGLGVSVAWYRNGLLGLLPLGLNAVYNFWTSMALLSGQRFMVTMDWSIYLYYMIGLFSIFVGFLMLLTWGRSTAIEWIRKRDYEIISDNEVVTNVSWHYYALVGGAFFILGALPVFIEGVFPDRYPHISAAKITSRLLASPSLVQSNVDFACIQKILVNASPIYVQGMALYPRYYLEGDGEKFTDAIGYKVADVERIVFELVGQGQGRVVFLLGDYPAFFPHASDVILIYDQNGKLWSVFVEKNGEEAFYVSKSFDYSLCR